MLNLNIKNWEVIKTTENIPDAYIVECRYGKIKVYIPIRSVKNNDSPCNHCPLRHTCEFRRKVQRSVRLHFFDDLRTHGMETPIEKVI